MSTEQPMTSTEEKLTRQTLVLNRGYLPIQITSVRHAIELLFQKRAKVVTEDYLQFNLDEWIVHSALLKKESELKDTDILSGVDAFLVIPKVILLTDYETTPRRVMRFRRRDVFTRDCYTCSYCLGKFQATELTIDHVLPRAKGGTTTWENCTTSCKPCNTHKADRTPEEAKMPLRNGVPKRPNAAFQFTKKIETDSTWQKFI